MLPLVRSQEAGKNALAVSSYLVQCQKTQGIARVLVSTTQDVTHANFLPESPLRQTENLSSRPVGITESEG